MASFSGAIRNASPGLPAYRVGEHPELLVDFTISGYDLAAWELEWHAYIFVLDLQGNTLASFRSDFNRPGLTWPDPDTRVVSAVLELPQMLLAQDMPVLVQLHGSTGDWWDGSLVDQVDAIILYEAGPPREGTYFTGSLTRLAGDKPSYKPGEYPRLSVDYLISAFNLSYWEDEWHSYLITMDSQGLEIAPRLRGDFSRPLFQPFPSPDTRQSLGNTITLYVPMGPQEMTVLVQLYGSTAEWQPWGFVGQKQIVLKPYVAPPLPPPGGKTNWPLVVGVGLAATAGVILLAGKEKSGK